VAAVRLVEADGPALVLGSTQAAGVADAAAAAARHVSVVRRRSGGGAVLVGTGDVVWVDVFVPTGDTLWDHDVGRATHWLGRAWTDALGTLGVEAVWHDGPLVKRRWSSLVCFAGLGPGEVRAVTASPAGGPVTASPAVGPGPKVVGISQRRTRAGTLFQCAAVLRWDPAAILRVLRLDESERSRAVRDLGDVAVGLADVAGAQKPAEPPTAAGVEDAFVRRLSTL